MKADRRHHLQENELAKWAAPKVQAVKPYGMLILGIIVAVVAIIVTVIVIQKSQESAKEQQWADVMRLTSMEYFEQQRFARQQDSTEQLNAQELQQINDNIERELRDVIATDETSLAAVRGKLFLADRSRTRGITAIFTDRSAALGQLDEAIDLYVEIAAAAEDQSIRDRAEFYRADALVARSGIGEITDLEKAKEIYKNLSKQGIYALAATEQLGVLDRASANPEGYFAWFHDQLERMEERSGSGPSDAFLPPGNSGASFPGSGSSVTDALTPPPAGQNTGGN